MFDPAKGRVQPMPIERPRSRWRLASIAVTGALLAIALALPVRADTIVLAGITTGAFSTATVVCEFNSQTNTFTSTITNTSAITEPTSTATITAIGYDLPPTGNASPSGLNGFTGNQAPSLSSAFSFSDADVGAVPLFPGSRLDYAFLTGGSFATGDPELGLLPGESASFTVSGAGFTGFTEEQICNSIYVRFEDVNAGEGTDIGSLSGDAPELFGISTGSLATASLACEFNAQTNTFTFTIKNTSPHDARITAIGFDLPPAGNASKSGLNGFTGAVTFQPAGTSFTFSDAALGKVPGVSGAVLDFGFVTKKNFAGGKAATGLAPGIDPGEEASFVVSGAAFAGFTENEICGSIYLRFQQVGPDGTLGDVARTPSL